jgi:hypothetical protein
MIAMPLEQSNKLFLEKTKRKTLASDGGHKT